MNVITKEFEMSKYTEKDAQDHTGANSSREVARAWHCARDDAAKSGHLIRGSKSTSDSRPFSKSDSSGQMATSWWKSIFG